MLLCKNDSVGVKNKLNSSKNGSTFGRRSHLDTQVCTQKKVIKKICHNIFKKELCLRTQEILCTSSLLASVLCVGDTVTNYPYKVIVLMKPRQFRSDYNKGGQWDDRTPSEPTLSQGSTGPSEKGAFTLRPEGYVRVSWRAGQTYSNSNIDDFNFLLITIFLMNIILSILIVPLVISSYSKAECFLVISKVGQLISWCLLGASCRPYTLRHWKRQGREQS